MLCQNHIGQAGLQQITASKTEKIAIIQFAFIIQALIRNEHELWFRSPKEEGIRIYNDFYVKILNSVLL